jgi:hypothetical protein
VDGMVADGMVVVNGTGAEIIGGGTIVAGIVGTIGSCQENKP